MKKFSVITFIIAAILTASMLLSSKKHGTDDDYKALDVTMQQDLEGKFKRFNAVIVGTLLFEEDNHWKIHIGEILKNHSASILEVDDKLCPSSNDLRLFGRV